MSYSSITEGLENLKETMGEEVKLSEKMQTYLMDKMHFGVNVMSKIKQTAHMHTAWMPFGAASMAEVFDGYFWYETYLHFAKEYEVPASWIACMEFHPKVTALGSSMSVEKVKLFDDDGIATEFLYAAHLDGVELGLIANPHFPYVRGEEETKVSDMAANELSEFAAAMDKSVVEVLDSLKKPDTFEMFTPYENDDSPSED